MNQTERRIYLIQKLLEEQPRCQGLEIPEDKTEQEQLLRSLFNIRRPREIDNRFLAIQDEYLQEETAEKGITELSDLSAISEGIYLWQGDITTLRCDAIVNAANSGMTGCYVPCHKCIDNCIHTYAGIQLRLACANIMRRQGREEETGKAKITPAFNLPCKYVIHTVGPIISAGNEPSTGTRARIWRMPRESNFQPNRAENLTGPTETDRKLLASCYRSCLEIAEEHEVKSIAFCCISTGEFHFPNDKAAEIAVQTVRKYKAQTNSNMEVIFNVFKDIDYKIYRDLLSGNR